MLFSSVTLDAELNAYTYHKLRSRRQPLLKARWDYTYRVGYSGDVCAGAYSDYGTTSGLLFYSTGYDKKNVQKMKIAVLGATGPTGHQVVMQALAKGYEVRALVRDPEKLTSQVKHDNLQVHKVDISQVDDLAGPMNGVDAVLSSLGGRAGLWTPCSVYTDSIETIVTAMRKAGVRRLIAITSWGAKDEPGLPWVISWVLKPLFLRHVLANMGQMEDYIVDKCSDINYTVVRPPGLSNQAVTENEVLTREGQFVENAANSIPRADVARFMLQCLNTDDFNGKMVAVGLPK